MTLDQIKNLGAKSLSFRNSLFNHSLLAVALLLPMLFVASCAESSSEKADRVGGVTAQQIIENPSAYVGKTVTVSGDVEEIHGPRAFNMDSGTSLGELLVVGREPFPQIPGNESRAYVINDVATVTGVIKMFNADEVKKDIGWDLDPNIGSAFNNKPVLIVSKAEFRAGNGGGTTATTTTGNTMTATDGNMMPATAGNTMTGENNGQPMAGAGSGQTMGAGAGNSQMMTGANNGKMAAGDNITDTGVYASTADKSMLAGKSAMFDNARVVRVVGPRTFTIASGNDEIYVMLDDESARGVGTQGKIDKGDRVNVGGTFERLQMDEIKDIKSNRFRALTDTERNYLEKTKLYLQANKVSGSK